MLTVDLFAGAGGFTEGAQQAGATVLWCANHWPAAVEAHAANHPEVVHSCQDLQQANMAAVPDHDLLLASPACQGASEAGQPGRSGVRYGKHVSNRPAQIAARKRATQARQQADRNTAWAVVACAEAKLPRVILVENTRQFLSWRLLPAWQQALELLGYTVRRHLFDCADFGTPQNRQRAVISASLDGPLELKHPGQEHRAFGPLIDWGKGEWRDWRELAKRWPGVGRRIDAALARGCGPRFLTHYVTGHRGREFGRPIGCVTTKAQWAAVDGPRLRMLSTAEKARAMDFPERYKLPGGVTLAGRLLGNAIPVRFARSLVAQAMGGAA